MSVVFYLLSTLRKSLYQLGFLPSKRFTVPLIVVGNITVGGTGKTPIVIALIKHFKAQGKKVGVVSRGYGGAHKGGSLLVDADTDASLSGDEPVLIAEQTQALVMVNKKRAQAASDLIAQHQVDIIISDDGLQHYAMGRSIEIAVVNGFGNGFFLPAGALREPISRLKSVDFVINNGTDAGRFLAKLTPKCFVNLHTGKVEKLDFFKGKTCNAVAAIGNPQRFFDSLSELGIKVKPHIFADHHQFTQEDLELDDYPIIMTAKDCVKCRKLAGEQMWQLHSETELDSDFLKKLDAKL
ncbi:MAG: tetraacyldisaccharide 4'-kinase [Candidatus Thioglobus sp.]|nr:MAG: tetraacyldisaccharide 4'-kinase [Candidatus Thioglobus sp.]